MGELSGLASGPYSQAYLEVKLMALVNTPSTYTFSVALVPSPLAESGMEKRATSVFVFALVVNST
ncbi:hypothetical protein D3C87_2182530 [compost metagenome]